MDDIFQYDGQELDLFQHVRNWKSYWSTKVRPYVTGRVLEVGAGLGANTLLLRTARQGRWVCLEPDRCLLEKLRSRLADSFTEPCELRHGSLGTVDFGTPFDTIVYIDVLEHIEDDRGELERASRLLDSGGTLIVLSPAHQFLFSKFDKAIGHFRRYNKATLAAIAPGALRQRRLFYLDSMGLIASLANRCLLKQDMPTYSQLMAWDRYMIPVSKIMDPLLGHNVGKTIVGIWQA